jgi:PPOX class probable F420-dependent enzyme
MLLSYLGSRRSVHTELLTVASATGRRPSATLADDKWSDTVIRLTEDEAWAEIASAHTGILTTLRRDGMPIALPVWFVAEGRTVELMTPARTKKIARVRRDPRAAFLVESGERWADLRGVHLTGRVEIVTDDTAARRIEAAVNAKYAAFRPGLASLPAATQAYYAEQVYLRFVPEGKILNWDNARIAVRAAKPQP